MYSMQSDQFRWFNPVFEKCVHWEMVLGYVSEVGGGGHLRLLPTSGQLAHTLFLTYFFVAVGCLCNVLAWLLSCFRGYLSSIGWLGVGF